MLLLLLQQQEVKKSVETVAKPWVEEKGVQVLQKMPEKELKFRQDCQRTN